MTIELTQTRSIRGVWQKVGTVHTISDGVAQQLIDGGFAKEVKPAPKPAPKPAASVK